jgi:hypothetical protein
MRAMMSIMIIVLLCSLSSVALALKTPEEPPQQEPTAQWTLQVDPLTTALGFVHLQVERALTPQLSVYAGPHLRLFDSVLSDVKEDYTGLGLELGVRWFFRPSAPAGWWLQARGVGAYLSGPSSATPGGYVSALGGYTAIFDGWFVLSGGAGVQYLHYRVDGLGPKGIFPALHTTIGVAF